MKNIPLATTIFCALSPALFCPLHSSAGVRPMLQREAMAQGEHPAKLPAPPRSTVTNPVNSEAAVLSAPPWKKKLDLIAAARSALSARLAKVHDKLRFMVTAERPDLLPRLEKRSPEPAATGYRLLPALQADEPDLAGSLPLERDYSIAELGEWVAREHGLVAELDSRLSYRLSPLERDVEFFNRRAENFGALDAHVRYHAFWQEQVLKWPSFWERKKQLLSLYRTWRAPKLDDGSPRLDEVSETLKKEMLRIDPSPALRIERDPSGYWSLPVHIVTDVTDQAFLAAFAEGIERCWNEARAMQDAQLRISLTWELRSPESLYPKGAPGKGEHLDLARHRELFGAAPFVLTTGADSTHVLRGAIFLGTGTVSRRTLAHEFAHLLGFEDAYIRAYEGGVDGRDGVVFREVTPFPESLLASPGRGEVTRGMVETLMGAYGKGRDLEMEPVLKPIP